MNSREKEAVYCLQNLEQGVNIKEGYTIYIKAVKEKLRRTQRGTPQLPRPPVLSHYLLFSSGELD